jgi:isoleucyl-tRNA synthetase
MEEYGADIIRLWALSVDYTADHRIGPEILKGVADQYRKLRNTFRYLLGALDGYTEAEAVPVADMPELERYMLSLLGALDARMKAAVEDFDFNTYTRALVDFCNEDLSAFFFDIRKDALYCDHPADLRRRAYRTTLDTMFHALIRYAAPVLVFTAEEVWRTRYPDGESVHLLEWPDLSLTRHPGPRAGVPLDEAADSGTPDQVRVDELVAKWASLRELRNQVSEAIEPYRRDKAIRSGLEAEVALPLSGVPEGFTMAELAEMFITGTVSLGETSDMVIAKTNDAKCGRCWRHLPEVTEDGDLCGRCDDVVTRLDAAAGAPV